MASLKSRRNLLEEHRKDAFDTRSDEDIDDERASVATARRGQAAPSSAAANSARLRAERERRLREEQQSRDDYQADVRDKEDDDDDDDRPSTRVSRAPRDQSGKAVNDAKIYVGNLPFTADKNDLEVLFATYGRIIGVNIRTDRLTNKPKGFAFVTFDLSSSAAAAVAEMNGFSFQGRALTVNKAELRGQKDSDADAAWKTVPTTSKKDKEQKEKKKASDAKSKATWDHWAGPSATAPSSQPANKQNKNKTSEKP